jgi:hypothetical protein
MDDGREEAALDFMNIWISSGDGDLTRVQEYVGRGQSVDAQDENGYTPLCVKNKRSLQCMA